MKVGDLIPVARLIYADQAEVTKVDSQGQPIEICTANLHSGENIFPTTTLRAPYLKGGFYVINRTF